MIELKLTDCSVHHRLILAIFSLAFSFSLSFSQSWNQLGADIEGSMGDGLGEAVAMSADGSVLAIGASTGPNGAVRGVVKVYSFDGSTWIQRGSDINGEADGDSFGAAISLSDNGNLIAIGAFPKDLTGSFAPNGRVQVYEWNGTSWVQKGSNIDGVDDFENLGQAVSLSGDGSRLAIGVPGQDTNGATAGGETGAVQVYEFGTDWTLLGAEIAGVEDFSSFGSAISLDVDGNTLAVGAAAFADGGSTSVGQVRVYRYNGTTWEGKGTTKSTFTGTGNQALGASISLSDDGNRLAIGAPTDLFELSNIGSVQIWDYASEDWTQVGSTITSSLDGDTFGQSVELSGEGTHVVIGAPGYLTPDNISGRAEIYTFNGTVWEQVGDNLTGEADLDVAGQSVAISNDGSIVAIGNPANDAGGADAGTVKIYEFGVVDITSPTVTITSTTSAITNANPISITVTFSEEVTGFELANLTVVNGTAGNLQTSDNTLFTADITPSADGAVTVDIAAGVAQDGASNGNEAATQFTRTFDGTAPTVEIQDAPLAINDDAFTITVEFSEDVINFLETDITLSNATTSNFQVLDGNTYTVDITPDGNGDVTIEIASSVTEDAAGNQNTAAGQVTVSYDIIAPVATIFEAPSTISSEGTQILMGFVDSGESPEEIVGFELSDITVTNGAASELQTNVNFPNVFAVLITPDDANDVIVEIAAGVVTDLAGNANTASDPITLTFADDTPPVVTVDTLYTNDQTPALTGTINDNNAAISVTVSGQTNDATNNGDGTWTLADNILTELAEGEYTISVTATDAFDNTSEAVEGFLDIDLTAPTIVFLNGAVSGITDFSSGVNVQPILVKVVFAEGFEIFGGIFQEVVGFTIDDINVEGDVSAALAPSQTDNSFFLALNLNDPDINQEITLTVPDGAATDLAGNASQAGTVTITYDINGPVVTSFEPTGSTNTASIPVAITFDEKTRRIDSEDFTITNGTIADLTTDTDSLVYTFNVIPAAEGEVTIQLQEFSVEDELGNSNASASEVISFVYDVTAPTVSIATTSADTTNVSPITSTITFSEEIILVADSLTVTGGTVNSLTTTDNLVYTLEVNPSAPTDAPATGFEMIVALEAGKVQDAAGNVNAETVSDTVVFDDVLPVIAFADLSGNPIVSAASQIQGILSFSESETVNLSQTDIDVENGTIFGFQEFPGSNGGAFVLGVTPSENAEEVLITIAAGVITDAAGNTNAATTFTVAIDNVAPTVEITSNITGPTNESPIPVTFTFSEEVRKRTGMSISVSAGFNLGELTTADVRIFTAEVTPAVEEGTLSIRIDQGVYADFAGNQNMASETFTLVYDAKAPVLTIDAPEAVNSTEAFEVSFSFDEAVESFDASNVSVTNGTLGDITADGNTYTAAIMPGEEGDITITVTGVADVLGNTSEESSRIIAFDATRPLITITGLEAGATIQSPDPLTLTFTFSEAVTGFEAGDINVENGSVSDFNNANAPVYTAAVMPTAEGAITITIAENAAQDVVGNGSEAVTFTYTYDQKYSGGSGTEADPYLIANEADLRELSTSSGDWGSYFLQIENIEMSEESFSPIGNLARTFTGGFDGQYFGIKGLRNVNPATINVGTGKGLFGLINGATLANISLIEIDIVSENDKAVSGLVASIVHGPRLTEIQNCFVSGSIEFGTSASTTSVAGPIVANARKVNVNDCFSSVSIIYKGGSDAYCGGILGETWSESKVNNSYSNSNIRNLSGSGAIGGVIGVQNILAHGDYLNINNSYFSGSIENSDEVISGGLLGLVKFENNDVRITNSFWDMEISGLDISADGGTGLGTTEMRQRETYANAGWDLTNTWFHAGPGYHPVLKWQVDNAKPFTVSGTVVDKDGEPFSNGTVKALFITAPTKTAELAADGSFTLSDIPGFLHSIIVEPNANETEHVKTFYGDANRSTLSRHVYNSVSGIQIQMIAKTDPNQLTGNGVVNGRVVDAGSGAGRIVQGRILEGEGLEGVTVFLVRTSDEEILTQVVTDENGDFEITGIPAGEHQLLLDVVGIDVNLEGSTFTMDEEGTPLQISAAVSDEGIAFAVEEVLGVEDEIEVTVYPNPVQSILNIQVESGQAYVRLLDLSGKVIQEQAFVRETQLDVRNLAEGVHFIEIVNEKGRSVRKLVKQ